MGGGNQLDGSRAAGEAAGPSIRTANQASIQSNQYSGGQVAAAPPEPRPGPALAPSCLVSLVVLRPRWRSSVTACLVLVCLLLATLPPAAMAAAGETPLTAAEIERQYRSGEPHAALQRLAQALAQRPGDAALRFLQAVLLADAGQTAQAQRLLERMTEEFPDLPEPYNNLAVLQAANGQLDQARSLLETALRLDPAYRTAHENLGDVFVRLAQRAYESAAGARVEPALETKLRLVRELAARH